MDRWRKFLRIESIVSFGWWVFERITNNWAVFVSLLGGGVMTYLARVSEWLEPWGPIGWGAVGIASFIFLLFTFTVVSMGLAAAREKKARALFSEKSYDISSINPLDDRFERKKIKLSEFYSPFFVERKNVSMINCEIFGPANVVLNGFTNLEGVYLNQCDVVIVADAPIFSAIAFENSSFVGSKFYRVTFCMDHELAKSFNRQIPGGINVISDGSCGPI